MSAVIFSGPKVKTLKAGLQLKDEAAIYSGSIDPSSAGFTANIGDLYISTSTGRLYSKIDTGGTDWAESGKVLGLTEDSIPFADADGNLTEDAQFTYDPGTQTLTVENLTVAGTTTTVNTATLDVTDANITINKNGNDASAEGAGLNIERTGTDGSLVYADALASKFKLGALGSEIEVANVSSSQTLTNKTINASNNTISNIGDSQLTTGIDAAKLSTGVVSNTEFDYLNGVTSAIQGQLDDKLEASDITGKADTDLGNLASTAVNVSIVPAVNNSISLGDASHIWATGRINSIVTNDISNLSLQPKINLNTSTLIGSDAANSVRYGERKLVSASTTKLDWSGTDLDINTRKIINVVDPTSDQDAATKKYVDDNAVDISGKADTNLGNLASTALNVDLLPSAGGLRDLGSLAKYFQESWAFNSYSNFIYSVTGGSLLRFELVPGIIRDASGNSTIYIDGYLLQDSSNLQAIDWDNRQLKSNTTVKLDWSGTDVSLNTRKLTNVVDPTADQDAATKKYVDDTAGAVGNPNDIAETEVVLADNQASAATAIDLSATSLRGFELLVTVERDTTFQVKKILGIKKNADWDINEENIGDDTGVVLTITSGGVIQYTSTSTGTAPTIRYRLKGIGVV